MAIAVDLAFFGARPSAIGLVLGTFVGAGIIGYRFTRTDDSGERSRQARRFIARSRRAAKRIAIVGIVMIVVGIWLRPVEILGVFWLAYWVTTLPIVVATAKTAH